MNEIILAVLAILLTSPGNLSSRSVPFDRIPPILASAYDADIRHWRNAQATEVAELDLDGDGCAEKLAFNGQSGSGGKGWTIFQKGCGGWRQIGEVFGIISAVKFKIHNGLLVGIPGGWNHATYNYYELKNGKFAQQLQISVDFAQPIREKPQRIEIKIADEK